MVRVIYAHPVVIDQVRYFKFAGLSTDEKPTEEVATGSYFIEVDTGDEFAYNEDTGKWEPQPSGGGGGGGTSNYNQLTNKPTINGVELSGNKSSSDLGITGALIPVFTKSSQGVWSCDTTFSDMYTAMRANELGEASVVMSIEGYEQEERMNLEWFDEDYQTFYFSVTKADSGSSGLVSYHRIMYTSANAITETSGTIGDVQIDGTSIVNNGVANIPKAGTSTLGTVMWESGYGVYVINNDGKLRIRAASTAQVKEGTTSYNPIVPTEIHSAAFYGMARAAGMSTSASIGNTVGTYSSAAKAAIQSMLGVEPGVCFVETVSGTTPSITAEANVRYICGEVSTISITPPSSGTTIVRFESGTTPAVLTLPSGVLFPDGLDLTTLEADTIYEIMITDGVYGGVVTWAD